MGNLKDIGPNLSESIYSGNYKCLIRDNQVVGIFVLTKIGNVILQTDRKYDYSDIILNSCLEEKIPIKGVLGEYNLTKAFLEAIQNRFPTLQTNLSTKEVLYRLDLNEIEESSTNDPNVRFLKESDLNEWALLNRRFKKELKLDQRENPQHFLNMVKKQ